MKTIILYQIRFYTGSEYSKQVGFKRRLVTRQQATKIVKRLKRSGVEAFTHKMLISVPKVVKVPYYLRAAA